MRTTIKTSTKEFPKFHIDVRCDDECNNGHDTFSITGSAWTNRNKRDSDIGGCIHDEILKIRPDLKLLVDLHLSDGDGVPMYAVENGYYHLQGYMGTAEYGHTMTRKDVADYLRVTEAEIQTLADSIKLLIDNDRGDMAKKTFIEWVELKKPQWKKEAELGKELIRGL